MPFVKWTIQTSPASFAEAPALMCATCVWRWRNAVIDLQCSPALPGGTDCSPVLLQPAGRQVGLHRAFERWPCVILVAMDGNNKLADEFFARIRFVTLPSLCFSLLGYDHCRNHRLPHVRVGTESDAAPGRHSVHFERASTVPLGAGCNARCQSRLDRAASSVRPTGRHRRCWRCVQHHHHHHRHRLHLALAPLGR